MMSFSDGNPKVKIQKEACGHFLYAIGFFLWSDPLRPIRCLPLKLPRLRGEEKGRKQLMMSRRLDYKHEERKNQVSHVMGDVHQK